MRCSYTLLEYISVSLYFTSLWIELLSIGILYLAMVVESKEAISYISVSTLCVVVTPVRPIEREREKTSFEEELSR